MDCYRVIIRYSITVTLHITQSVNHYHECNFLSKVFLGVLDLALTVTGHTLQDSDELMKLRYGQLCCSAAHMLVYPYSFVTHHLLK